MTGKQDRNRRHLFIAGEIDKFIPEDHIKHVDRVFDLRWLRETVGRLIVKHTDGQG